MSIENMKLILIFALITVNMILFSDFIYMFSYKIINNYNIRRGFIEKYIFLKIMCIVLLLTIIIKMKL